MNRQIKTYSVTLTIIVDARTEQEALDEFNSLVTLHNYNDDNLEIEDQSL